MMDAESARLSTPWLGDLVVSVDTERLVAEFAGVAAGPGGAAERARALLAPLRRITPFDAALITLFDPESRRQQPVLMDGYDAQVRRHLTTRQALAVDVERAGMQRPGPPLRLSDLPAPLVEGSTWTECLYPAGLRNGIATGLFTADGRFLGLFAAQTATPEPANDAACALLRRVAPLLAHAVDPLRTIGAMAGVVADAAAGVVVTRRGNTMPLAGLPDHRLLAVGAPLLATATTQLANGPEYVAFLCPDDAGPGAAMTRVTALACPPRPPGHLRAIVLLSPPPRLYGLTRRELEILGLLVEGWSNAQVAAALAVSVRTVTAHLEHILVRLGAASRTMATVRAVRQGLFIPRELSAAAPAGRVTSAAAPAAPRPRGR